MKVFSVFGHSKTGKTTTVELIIQELVRRKYKVGSVKDIHFQEFKIDKEGTDTYRHKAAGAEPVTARGLNETDIMFKERKSLRETIQHYDVDWVVCEGFSDEILPKFLSLEDKKDLEKIDDFTIGLTGKISSKPDSTLPLPVFDATKDIKKLVDFIEENVPEILPGFTHEICGECGFDCRAILKKILKENGDISLCHVRQFGVKVKVGTKYLPLKPFVKDILARVYVGALSSLTGFENGKKVIVEIEGLYLNFKKEEK